MLQEIWLWWLDQWREMLPLDRLSRTTPDALIIGLLPGEPAISLHQRENGREAEAGRFPSIAKAAAAIRALLRRRRLPVILRPPAALLLERQVVLPLAAERDLARVLGFEMDRLTPFRADAVFWDSEILSRDKPNNRLSLRLSMVPRATLAPVTDALAGIGLAPTALEFPASGGGARRLPLEHERDRAWPVTLAAWICAALALAALAQPFALQSWRRHAVEVEIDRLSGPVRTVQALRERIARAEAGTGAIAGQQAETGNVLQVLAVLTEILPDDSYVTDFSLRGRTLTLQGNARNAAGLIGALSADPLIRDASFSAPITRNPNGTDHFTIISHILP